MAGYDGGVITRKDIITDEALQFGKVFKENVDISIGSVSELLKLMKQVSDLSKSVKVVDNQADFRKIQEQNISINQRLTEQTNKLAAAEKELNRIKRESIKNNTKVSETKKQSTKATMNERVQLMLKNQTEREASLLLNLHSESYRRLNLQRTIAKRTLQDLIASEKASNAEIRKAQREFDILDAKVKKADKAVRDFSKNVGNYPLFSLTNQLAGALGWAGAVQTSVALFRSFADTIISFDSGLLNVSKTTGIAGDELKSLGEDVRKLALELQVVPVNNLLEYATVAGQLGVKGSENIMKFTKALAMLETATNIKGEEGAAEIARLLTLVDGGVENVAEFGDEIVKLGNNFAATEKEILDNATAIAQNTGVYKIGRQAALAYGTATKAVGIEAEITGSTIGRTLAEIEKSIRTGENIDKLAKITKKSVSELKAEFKTDTASVLYSFVTGLNEIDKSGGSVLGTLDSLGITAVRDKRVIASLATGGYDVLTRALEDVQSAQGAMTEEFDTASGKIENSIKTITVAWDEFALAVNTTDNAIGNFFSNFARGAAAMISWITRISTSWNELNKQGFENRKKSGYSQGMADFLGVDINNKYIKETYKTQRDELAKTIGMEEQRIAKLTEKKKKLEEENNQNWFTYATGVGLGIGAFSQGKIGQINQDLEKANENLGSMKGRLEGMQQAWQDNIDAANGVKKATEKPKMGINQDEKELSDKEKRKLEREAAKAKKDALKNEKDEIDKRKKLFQNEIDLNIWKKENINDVNEELSKDEKLSYDERFAALDAAQKAEEESLRLNAEKQLTLASNFVQGQVDLTKKEIQSYLDGNVKLDELSNDKQLIIQKYFSDIEKLQKKYQKSQEGIVKSEAEKIIKKSTQTNESSKIAMNDEIGALQPGNSLKDIEAYEKAVADIKIKYTKMAIQEQINGLKEVLQLNIKNDEEILKYSVQLSEAEQKLQDETNKNEKENLEKSLEKNKEYAKKMEEIIQELHKALTDLTNAIFEARIQRIDEEIARNEEKTEREMELYEGNDEKQRQIQQRAEAEREVLEEKKRKEQRKQAIFNKAMTIAEIGMNTALAIMKAYADAGPIGGSAFAILISILGAIQTAAVLATPIPKYKIGRKGGKEEIAIVGDGGVSEVVEHKDGSAYLTPKTDTLVKLLQGDTVHKSVEDYRKDRSRRLSANLQKEMVKSELYLNSKDIETKRLEFEISSMHKTLRDKKMQTVVNVPKLDISSRFWKFGQRGW